MGAVGEAGRAQMPNRFSVLKLVLLSGSTSAQGMAQGQRQGARLSAMAAMASRSGLSGPTPLA